ncbi:hypothetical protein CC2G_013038 [Coprinopsis cinerea AmutBmut pab1-1]|nr:hypothetical protein CC2G_013038 [Coprinopsis cinerea AmutBmut pab1-1]
MMVYPKCFFSSPSLLSSTSGLASLSLSSSPPPGSYPAHLSSSFTGASRKLAPAPPNPTNSSNHGSSGGNPGSIPIKSGEEETNDTGAIPIPSANGRTGKKRGIDHKCESCSKIYRHPSCLIKHRWEHTPHWREASKYVLSKHQQVQLLEAAAILSHMSPAATGGRSLPEDRSLWPSFLSGGSLPPPESATKDTQKEQTHNAPPISPSNSYVAHPVSSSVPARAMSTGPRLHDYGVSPGAVTQVRPGLIGVPTAAGVVAVIGDRAGTGTGSYEGTQPVPVPAAGAYNRHGYDAYGAGSASIGYSRDNWGSYSHGSHQAYAGGVSLPNSSVRSASSPPPSPSRSRSGSLEDRSARQRRLSDDSPPSDDGVFDEMDGIEDDRHSARGIRIVGDRERYGHRSTRSYDSFTGRYGRGYGAGSYGRRLVKRDEDDDFDYAVREEDEDMDNMDGVGRLRKPPLQKREEQWDGMDMDMDMD